MTPKHVLYGILTTLVLVVPLLLVGQLTSGAIAWGVWEVLWEHAPWFARFFYTWYIVGLRDGLAFGGANLMGIALIVCALHLMRFRLWTMFSREVMFVILCAGMLCAAPFVGMCLAAIYGVDLFHIKLMTGRTYTLELDQLETWVPWVWASSYALGAHLAYRLAISAAVVRRTFAR